MYCEKCGNKLIGIEKYCGNCGSAITLVNEQNQSDISSFNNVIPERNDIFSIVTPSLLNDEINKAIDTLIKIEPYETDINKCQLQLNSIHKMGTFIRVLLFIFGILLTSVSGIYGVVTFFVSLIFVILAPIKYKNDSSDPVYKKIKQDNQQIEFYLSSTASCIPIKFIYPNAIYYMKDLVEMGRATNMSDAIDKLEEQEHRWEIEEKQNQLLDEQKRQTQELRSIQIATWMSNRR